MSRSGRTHLIIGQYRALPPDSALANLLRERPWNGFHGLWARAREHACLLAAQRGKEHVEPAISLARKPSMPTESFGVRS